MNPAPEAVEHVFREESGKILATLIGYLGDFDEAEEAMQDAFGHRFRAVAKRWCSQQPGSVDRHRGSE